MTALINSGLVKVGVEALLVAVFCFLAFSFITRLAMAAANKRAVKITEIWLMAITLGLWYFVYNF